MAAESRSPVRWTTAFIDVSSGDSAAAARFWCDVTGSSLSGRRGERGEFTTLGPPDGDPFLRMQDLVAGPAGCHLDLHVDDVASAAEQAIALGAGVRADAGPIVVLASPGGFVFCLVPHRGESHRPTPVRWPGGHRSLVDQLCLDIPAPAFESEGRFWATLTDWELYGGSRPAFSVLGRPVGQPLRLLLQRLVDAEPGQAVTAHLDLACDGVDAEVDRHLALGARVVRRMPNWVTLADPTGRHYCVTRRDPDTGVLAHRDSGAR